MSDDGTAELAALENDGDLQRVCGTSVVSRAIEQLLATAEVGDRIVLLQTWSVDYPCATARLLSEIAQEPALATRIASAVVAGRVLDSELKDEVLAAAFPNLTGPLRDAAADREGVRRMVGLRDGHGYIAVPAPDPAWLWPSDKLFPDVDTVAGVQARLNYLGLAAGPVNDEWNDLTRNAYARFQVLNGLPPTGEWDFDSSDRLAVSTPECPE